VDLRLLEYFTAVAELEHIGRAAERLHISQSPLSRQIRQLEKDLQLELFVRERQRIRLTESGRWLLNQARGLLAHAEKVRDEAAQRAKGKTGTLSIAFVSGAMWSGVLPKLLKRFQAEFPDATLELRNMRSTLQMEAVESGRFDLGFVSMPATSSAIESTCVAEEPFHLVAPTSHPLSRKRAITPQDLDGARWIVLSGSQSPGKHDRFLGACEKAGFAPGLIQTVTEPTALLALVDSGFGVGLIQSSARNYAPRSLKFRELRWLSFQSRSYMIRPAATRQPLADSFAACVPAYVRA
jgi:DNA-binding transcriptional LysR family regulator